MNAQTKIQASLPDLLRNAREAAREYEGAVELQKSFPRLSAEYADAGVQAEIADVRLMNASSDLFRAIADRCGLTLPELREIYERFL